MTELDEPLEWGVVANVAGLTRHGPGGAEVQAGLKHFAPGARLWVCPPRYRTEDERVQVVGVHRGTGARYVSTVLLRRHLENFRLKGVYSPAVRRARERSEHWSWNRVWCCPELADPWVERWNTPAAELVHREYPPWPVRWTSGAQAGPCPHGPSAAP